MKYFLLISATLLVIALASLPMGYYTFLRIVVTIAAVLAAIHEYKQGEFNAWVIAFGLTAVLFNPLIPVYFHGKDIWTVIDLATAALFVVEYFRINKIDVGKKSV
jgi:hypothetical protein